MPHSSRRPAHCTNSLPQTMTELLKLAPVLQEYGDTAFSIVIAWAVTTLGKSHPSISSRSVPVLKYRPPDSHPLASPSRRDFHHPLPVVGDLPASSSCAEFQEPVRRAWKRDGLPCRSYVSSSSASTCMLAGVPRLPVCSICSVGFSRSPFRSCSRSFSCNTLAWDLGESFRITVCSTSILSDSSCTSGFVLSSLCNALFTLSLSFTRCCRKSIRTRCDIKH